MDALERQGNKTPTKGFWESELVSKKRKALLAKGAQQGWLMDKNELQIGERIGHGSFGQTHAATWRGTKVCFRGKIFRGKMPLPSTARK
jgi:serine/threonine protein kinase